MIHFPAATVSFVEFQSPHGPFLVNATDIVLVQPSQEIGKAILNLRCGIAVVVDCPPREAIQIITDAARETSY